MVEKLNELTSRQLFTLTVSRTLDPDSVSWIIDGALREEYESYRVVVDPDLLDDREGTYVFTAEIGQKKPLPKSSEDQARRIANLHGLRSFSNPKPISSEITKR